MDLTAPRNIMYVFLYLQTVTNIVSMETSIQIKNKGA